MRGYAWEQATTFIKNFVEGNSYWHLVEKLSAQVIEIKFKKFCLCLYFDIFEFIVLQKFFYVSTIISAKYILILIDLLYKTTHDGIYFSDDLFVHHIRYSKFYINGHIIRTHCPRDVWQRDSSSTTFDLWLCGDLPEVV
jgi:hypothetical protein